MVAAAFVPYLALSMAVAALHFHPLFTGSGSAAGQHLTATTAASSNNAPGYVCPICSWQRNSSHLDIHVSVGPAVVSAQTIVLALTIERPDSPTALPTAFRGPPTSSL